MHNMHDAPDTELLRLFDILHNERHLTRAALRAGLSQPAMSRALGRMRRAFGDPLFVRTQSGMVPTTRADALAPEVRAVLEQMRTLMRPGELEPASLERTFVVAMADFVEAHLFDHVVARIAAEAPKVDLVLRPLDADAGELLESGRLDLIIAVRGAVPAGLVAKHLFDDSFLCAVRRDHPRLKKKGLTLDLYTELSHIQIAPRGTKGGPVDRALAARGLARRVAIRTNSFLAAPLLVASSDLVLTAPSVVLTPLARPLGLRTFPPPLEVQGFRVVQAWHPRSQADPAHAWFRAILASAARPARKRR
jgi:DNA-binding transcriptional LysR family regulator